LDEFLTAVSTKAAVFWVATSRNSKRATRNGGICRLHLQSRRMSWASRLLPARFLLDIFLDFEGGDTSLRNLEISPLTKERIIFIAITFMWSHKLLGILKWHSLTSH
jgi:hypothetical protein